jgi:molybdopterin-binding protein
MPASSPPPWHQGGTGWTERSLLGLPKSLNSAPSSPEVPSHAPARNQFPGLVTRVVRDHIMAQVEIQAGPHWIVSLVPVKVVDKLKLKPGSHAIASVAPTDVIVRPSPTGATVRRDERY